MADEDVRATLKQTGKRFDKTYKLIGANYENKSIWN